MTALRLSVALCLVLYLSYRRTCPGFPQWVGGAVVAACAPAVRILVPLDATALFGLQGLLHPVTTLLVLDGVLRYQTGRALDRRAWLIPPLASLGASLAVSSGNTAVAIWIVVVASGGATLAGGLLWLRPHPRGRVLRAMAAALHGFSLAVTVAGGVWLTQHQILLMAPLLLLANGMVAVMFMVLIVMLHSFRLEEELRDSRLQTEAAVDELRTSLQRVEQLSGILPVCSACKRIRDEDGAWSGLEEYLSHRTEARFTSRLCTACRAGTPA